MEGSTSAEAHQLPVVFRSVPAGQQVAEFGHIFCRSQQEEDGVKIAFSGTTPFSRRKLARIVAGTPKLHIRRYVHQYLELSATVCTVDKVLVLCVAFKRMPVLTGYNLKKRRSTAICAVSYDCQGFHPPVQERTGECAGSYRGSISGINTVNHTIHPHITTADTFCILALISSAANSG